MWALLSDTLAGLSCRTLLSDTLVGHPCGALLLKSPRVSTASASHKICAKKSHVKSAKTSVSYETSSKMHLSSLQNQRFPRDFLKNAQFKSAKRAFRTRLPPRFTRLVSKTSVSYETASKAHVSKSPDLSTHTSSSPAEQSRLQKHPLTRQSQNIHLHHNSQPQGSLRLPRKFARPHL